MKNQINLQALASEVGGTVVTAGARKKLILTTKDNLKVDGGLTLTFTKDFDGFDEPYTVVRLSDGTRTLNAQLMDNNLDLVDFDYGSMSKKNPEDLSKFASPSVPKTVTTRKQLANWCLIHMRRHFVRFAGSPKQSPVVLVSISLGKLQGAGVKLDKKTAQELYGKLRKILKGYEK
jgi:hypothetical protein